MERVMRLVRRTRILPEAHAFWTVAVLLFTAGLAQAGPITYVESVTASGSLGGTSFTNQLVTLTMIGNTSGVLSASGIFANAGTLVVNVAGVGSGTFTNQMAAFDDQTGPFADFQEYSPDNAIVLSTNDAAFASYGLGTAIGPITDTGFIDPGLSFPTTDGAFIIDSAGDSTFTATTAPEPGTFVPFVLGLAGIASLGRLRRRGAGARRPVLSAIPARPQCPKQSQDMGA
jgi:hypothetical protein